MQLIEYKEKFKLLPNVFTKPLVLSVACYIFCFWFIHTVSIKYLDDMFEKTRFILFNIQMNLNESENIQPECRKNIESDINRENFDLFKNFLNENSAFKNLNFQEDFLKILANFSDKAILITLMQSHKEKIVKALLKIDNNIDTAQYFECINKSLELYFNLNGQANTV